MLFAVRQAEMYGAIGEEDVLAGLWKRRCRTENTRAGEMLMQVTGDLLLLKQASLQQALPTTSYRQATRLAAPVGDSAGVGIECVILGAGGTASCGTGRVPRRLPQAACT